MSLQKYKLYKKQRRRRFHRGPPERSRRNRRPARVGVEDADCQRVSEASALPTGQGLTTKVCQAALWPSVAPSCRGACDPDNEGTLASEPVGDGSQGAALAVGVVARQRSGTGRPTRWLGEWGVWLERSVLGRFRRKTVCEGHGLPEKRQISWLEPRARCPKVR